MRARPGRAQRGLLLAILAAALAGGCFRSSKRPVPVPEAIVLEIQNHAFADVDIYIVSSPSDAGSQIRLTTVSGFAKGSVRIRVSQLQPGNTLQLSLHAIGTTRRWLTTTLSVSPGDHAMLEINSDAGGNLSRSVLYPLPDQSN